MQAVLFYDVATAVHVMGVVIAFGVTFAYPVIHVALRRHPRALPAVLSAQALLTRALITPAMTVVLVTGIYMASDRDLFDRPWVSVPMAILIILFGLSGAFFGPNERRAAEFAARDVESAGAGEPVWSGDTQATMKRLEWGGRIASVLVLVAIYFMVVKPGGY